MFIISTENWRYNSQNNLINYCILNIHHRNWNIMSTMQVYSLSGLQHIVSSGLSLAMSYVYQYQFLLLRTCFHVNLVYETSTHFSDFRTNWETDKETMTAEQFWLLAWGVGLNSWVQNWIRATSTLNIYKNCRLSRVEGNGIAIGTDENIPVSVKPIPKEGMEEVKQSTSKAKEECWYYPELLST